MARCLDCKHFDASPCTSASGAILSKKVGHCLWKPKQQWPIWAVGIHAPTVTGRMGMPPKEHHRCQCFCPDGRRLENTNV